MKRGDADIAVGDLQGNGQSKDDPTFGQSTVFHDHVAAVVPGNASTSSPSKFTIRAARTTASVIRRWSGMST